MNKIAIITVSLILVLVLGLGGCVTEPAPVYAPAVPQPESAQDSILPTTPTLTAVPQPKVWQTLPNEEYDSARDVCYFLVKSSLTGLASTQDAFDYVESFFTHTTISLSSNGAGFGSSVDLTGKEVKVYCECPENAWWLKVYGMFPTQETIEAQIDNVTFPMTKYDVPERWGGAVWLIFTDGTVMPYYNKYSKSDAAFKVEEDIAKLNNGIELDFDWRR